MKKEDEQTTSPNEYFEIEGEGKYGNVNPAGQQREGTSGLSFLPRTSFEVSKEHKNVFYIDDPDEEDV